MLSSTDSFLRRTLFSLLPITARAVTTPQNESYTEIRRCTADLEPFQMFLIEQGDRSMLLARASPCNHTIVADSNRLLLRYYGLNTDPVHITVEDFACPPRWARLVQVFLSGLLSDVSAPVPV